VVTLLGESQAKLKQWDIWK